MEQTMAPGMASSINPRIKQRVDWVWRGVAIALLAACGWLSAPGNLPTVTAQDVAPAAAPAAAADKPAANGGATPTEPQKSYLQWAFKALGWRYTIVFLALSVTVVALMVMSVVEVRRGVICPPELVEGFEQNLTEKKYQEAYELAKSDESFLGTVLSAGLAKLNLGYEKSLEAMQEVGEEEVMKLEQRLSIIQLIATISPMVGLFGTVDGMIASFRLLTVPGVTPKPWELADGISTALFTTLLGLAIAIPAMGFFHIIKNRLARLVLEVGMLSEGLMNRFEPAGGVRK